MKGHLKKRGEVWYVVLYLGRDPVTQKKKYSWQKAGRTKKEAEKKLHELINQIDNNIFIEPKKLTIAEYLLNWIDTYVKQNLATLTQESYIRDITKHIIPVLGNIPLQKLQPLHIQQYYTFALEKGRLDGKGGLSPKMVVYHHRILTKALNTAIKHRLIQFNPAGENVELPKVKKYRVQPYEEKDYLLLLKKINGDRLEIPVNMALAGDLRRGEVLGAKWSKLNWKTGAFLVDEQLIPVKKEVIFKSPKSEDGIRTIIFPPSLIEMLKKHKQEQDELKDILGEAYVNYDLINCQPDGKPIHPGTFSHWFKDFLTRNKLPLIRFHDLKHTGVTINLNNGVPINIVSKNAGHSTSSFTIDVYGHLMNSGQKFASDNKQKVIYDKLLKEFS